MTKPQIEMLSHVLTAVWKGELELGYTFLLHITQIKY